MFMQCLPLEEMTADQACDTNAESAGTSWSCILVDLELDLLSRQQALFEYPALLREALVWFCPKLSSLQ